ncbi:hypothetical protein HK104_002683 [Borealophlyctis nickersoniae]|nr:hypothetical protein HK104_002683 [Borealophlyctis nickersoniae]
MDAPQYPDDCSLWRLISQVLGWGYFLAWSISFYPQVFLNRQLQSVVGLSLDFVYLNLWGFFCYSIYNVSFYASAKVRDAYRERWGSENLVRGNDVAFGLHAVGICAITLWQTIIYARDESQKLSAWAKNFIIVSALGGAVLAVSAYIGTTAVLDVLYYTSTVKMKQ